MNFTLKYRQGYTSDTDEPKYNISVSPVAGDEKRFY